MQIEDQVTRRNSTSGYFFLVYSLPVTWSSKKQNSTILSSTEAEYCAAYFASCEAIWLSQLLRYNQTNKCATSTLVPRLKHHSPLIILIFYNHP